MKTENNDMESRIVEVARETFMENGYVETSMSEIATRVGISRPALHYYFRTKDKMFQAVLAVSSGRLLQKYSIFCAKKKPLSQSEPRESSMSIFHCFYNIRICLYLS